MNITVESLLNEIQAAGYARCRLYLIDRGSHALRGLSLRGHGEEISDKFAQVKIDPRSHAFPNGHARLRSESEFDFYVPSELRMTAVEQWIELPLLYSGQMIGMLSVDNNRRDGSAPPLTEADIPILERFAASLAQALEEERHVAEELYVVREIPGAEVVLAQPRIVSATEALVERLRKQPSDLFSISPRAFEELVAHLLDDMGWEVKLTGKTRDGGRDILAFLDTPVGRLLCLVEAKRYRRDRPVGVDLVRNVYGTLCHEQANAAMLVTTSSFTGDAKKFQLQHRYQLSLKEYADVVAWVLASKTKR